MAFTVACVLRSGSFYNPTWVSRLKRQVDVHLSPERFICLSDVDEMLAAKWCETVPLSHAWPGWYSKLELFRPGISESVTAFFDLDTLVLGPIQRFREFTGPLALLDDFCIPGRAASGVMVWTPSAASERIYHEYVKNPRDHPLGDGGIIGQYPHQRLQSLFPGVFGSYKVHGLTSGPKHFSVCCAHGRPKWHELPIDSWAHRAWIGEA